MRRSTRVYGRIIRWSSLGYVLELQTSITAFTLFGTPPSASSYFYSYGEGALIRRDHDRSSPDSIHMKCKFCLKRRFFWPMWYGEEIQYTHERDDYDFYGTNQYTSVFSSSYVCVS